jgi:hypothetical protein
MCKDDIPNVYLYLFNKLDGSNIRAEWNKKKGFYKFGTRHELINENSKPFGQAIPLIKNKYEDDLSKIFIDKKWESVVCFFEYWGPSSFAGHHNFDEVMDVTLFDVNPFKNGLLSAADFISIFGHLDIPAICYSGYMTQEIFDQIRGSTLPNMTFEGVVAKGLYDKQPIMYKIKTEAWLGKLRDYCKGDESLFNRLE